MERQQSSKLFHVGSNPTRDAMNHVCIICGSEQIHSWIKISDDYEGYACLKCALERMQPCIRCGCKYDPDYLDWGFCENCVAKI